MARVCDADSYADSYIVRCRGGKFWRESLDGLWAELIIPRLERSSVKEVGIDGAV